MDVKQAPSDKRWGVGVLCWAAHLLMELSCPGVLKLHLVVQIWTVHLLDQAGSQLWFKQDNVGSAIQCMTLHKLNTWDYIPSGVFIVYTHAQVPSVPVEVVFYTELYAIPRVPFQLYQCWFVWNVIWSWDCDPVELSLILPVRQCLASYSWFWNLSM